MSTVWTLNNFGTVRVADRRTAFLRWQAHGICVLCPPICCRYRHIRLAPNLPMGSLNRQERLTYSTRRSSGKTSRKWHSQPHQLQHELQWLLLLPSRGTVASNWYFRFVSMQMDKHNVMVTWHEDKHCLLQDTLCGQNVIAGGTHSYLRVLKVKVTTTRTQSVFLRERLKDCLLHTSCNDTCLETDRQPDRSFALPRRRNCVLVQVYM